MTRESQKSTSDEADSASVARTAVDALTAKASAVLVAGYQPIPENDAVYRRLLQVMLLSSSSPTNDTKAVVPRQSPLVSAGYAMRVASMARMVHSFIDFHQQQTSHGSPIIINIVLLGCGMDVLGLWAHSLTKVKNNDNDDGVDLQIHIWEVDSPSVARRKRDKLLQEGLVLPASANKSKDDDPRLVLEGRIQEPVEENGVAASSSSSSSNATDEPSNYHLIAADLCDLDSLEAGLGNFWNASNSTNGPTLVLVELVLAYLGTDSSTDQLLEWCASNLLVGGGGCKDNNSGGNSGALVAFEALGGGNPPDANDVSSANFNSSNNNNNNQKAPEIVRAYQHEYTRQFQAKLQRGKSSSTNQQQQPQHQYQSDSSFSPLGSTHQNVQQRISQLEGYSHSTVHACLAGTAAYRASQQKAVQLTVPSGELFDEHAALSLHLASYVQVVAFPETGGESYTRFRLSRQLCPWDYSLETTLRDHNADDDAIAAYFVTGMELGDEAAVRTIFGETYKALADQYATIKKMVKRALKELTPTPDTNNNVGTSQSTIRLGFQRLGGDFLVAVRYNDDGSGERRRQVLGGIGVRKWASSAPVASNTQHQKAKVLPTYEINRLFVAEEHRGHGLGKVLLQMAETVVASKNAYSTRGVQATPYRIVATTLVLLEEANHVYTKQGYYLLEEPSIGELRMKTYAKDFP